MNKPVNEVTNQQNVSQKPMPINLARATFWTFRPYKGQPMGILVDTKQLSLKDLGYAIENAWDERVRQAAIALMLVGVDQAIKDPAPFVGPLRVISGGRSFALRRQFLLRFAQGIIGGIVFGLLLAYLIVLLTRIVSSPGLSKTQSNVLSSPIGIVVLLVGTLLLLGIAWILYFLFEKLMTRLDKQIDNYRKGEEGEERSVAAIQQALDGSWSLFRNVVLPGRKGGDLDAVLVGPSGVWVLETKTFTGEYRNTGEHWEYRAGNRWKSVKKSPSRQAKTNAARLGNFLKADNIEQWVFPAVIWAEPNSPLTVENPAVAVWSLDRLHDGLGNVRQGKPIPEENRVHIVEKLTKLCEKQQKAWQEKSDQ